MHVAAKRGLVDTVGYLVDKGADINTRDCNLVSELVMHICVRMVSLPCISKRTSFSESSGSQLQCTKIRVPNFL